MTTTDIICRPDEPPMPPSPPSPANLRAQADLDARRARSVEGWGEDQRPTRQQHRAAMRRHARKLRAERAEADVSMRRTASKLRARGAVLTPKGYVMPDGDGGAPGDLAVIAEGAGEA